MFTRLFARRGRSALRYPLATVLLGLAGAAAQAGGKVDWGCGFHRPPASFPANGCFGYYPTVWHAWPAECQPQALIVTAPAAVPVDIPVRTPAPQAVPPAPPPVTPPVPPGAPTPPKAVPMSLRPLPPSQWRGQ
jgi:hypothetical protein